MIPIGINIGDSYTDGFEVVGDLSKKRKKNLEVYSSLLPLVSEITDKHY